MFACCWDEAETVLARVVMEALDVVVVTAAAPFSLKDRCVSMLTY